MNLFFTLSFKYDHNYLYYNSYIYFLTIEINKFYVNYNELNKSISIINIINKFYIVTK